MLAKRFSDYEGLAQWVRDQGYDFSEDSHWRYGKSLKQEFTAIRLSLLQARTLARNAPDHKGRMMGAGVQVVRQRLLSALAEKEGPLTTLIYAASRVQSRTSNVCTSRSIKRRPK
jgi:hypothetical protein